MTARLSWRRLFWTAALFALWLLLSRSLDPLHLAIGACAAFVVVLMNTAPDARGTVPVRWLSAVAYGPWLFSRILLSGLRLSYLILHPRLPIRPRLFRHAVALDNEDAIMLLSSSITLTPGTITVEADDSALTVHAIDGESADDVTSTRLEGRVASVFAARRAAR